MHLGPRKLVREADLVVPFFHTIQNKTMVNTLSTVYSFPIKNAMKHTTGSQERCLQTARVGIPLVSKIVNGKYITAPSALFEETRTHYSEISPQVERVSVRLGGLN